MINLSDLKMRRHAPYLIETVLNKRKNWKWGAEIGVAQGRTLLGIMQNCPQLKMYAVDAFQYIPDSENSGLYSDMDHNNNEECVEAIRATYPDRVFVLKGISYEMAKCVSDESLDFIFIDASHMYEEVKKDIIAWFPKVKKGGWLLGHDYCARWDGVRRAVDEVLGKPITLQYSIWAFAKDDLKSSPSKRWGE